MSEQQNDFESALNSYKDRLSEFKDVAERLASGKDPLDTIRQVTGMIGTPLSIDLLKTGFKGQYSNAIQSFKDNLNSKADEAIQTLKSKVLGLGDQVQDTVTNAIGNAQDMVTNTVGNARDAAMAARNAVNENVQNIQDTASGITDGPAASLGGARPYVVPGSEETPEFTTLPDSGTVMNPSFDPDSVDLDTGGMLGQNVGSETSDPFTDGFTGTPEQLSTMDDILNARIPIGLNQLTDQQFDAAVQSRYNAIVGGQAKATPGELDDMDPITRARFSDDGSLLEAGQEATQEVSVPVGVNQFGGLRGDSTLARAGAVPTRTPAPAPEETPPAPTPDPVPAPDPVTTTVPEETAPDTVPDTVPETDLGVDADLGVGDQVENVISSNVSALSRLTGVGTDAAESLLSGASAGLSSAVEGLGVDSGLIASGETIAATTGAETGGVGALVGGLVTLGGVLASVFAPHKEEPEKAVPNFSAPALQVGLGA
jgi:hypothetical protein